MKRSHTASTSRLRSLLRMGLLTAAWAACTRSDDEPPTARRLPDRPAALPPEYAAVANFCSVPASSPADAPPAGSRPLAIGADQRVDLRGAPFPVALRCTLRTPGQWEQLWMQIDPDGTPPSAPGNGMVVLAAAGMAPSDGHALAIDSAWVAGDTAIVLIRERHAGNACPAADIVTYPAAAILIPPVAVVRYRERVVVGEPCY